MRSLLLNEMYSVIEGEIGCSNFWLDAKEGRFSFKNYLQARKKRLSVTMMFLCDNVQMPDLSL